MLFKSHLNKLFKWELLYFINHFIHKFAKHLTDINLRVDLCQELMHSGYIPCLNGGECSHKPGSTDFECNCLDEYYGDRCELQENKCSPSPCHNGRCVWDAKHKLVHCECFAGWTGKYCGDPSECLIADHCEVNNTAKVVRSLLTEKCVCICKHGYEGRECEKDFDDCEAHSCKNGAKCVDLVGSYTCICPKGFTGEFCQTKIEKCLTNPCKNGN